MQTLSYQTLAQTGYRGYLLPSAPEKVLQFGEGNFLRAFVDYWFDLANEKVGWNGKCCLVQPIAPGLAKQINAQQGLYTLYLRGRQNGEKIDQKRVISSVSRCLNPYEKEGYEAMMAVAVSDDLEYIVSNTTEAGIVYDPACQPEDCPPASFPAKLTQVLYARYGAGKPGVVILSCELIDNNGKELLKCVNRYIDQWNLGDGFRIWVNERCLFCSTLVDRIVPGRIRDAGEAARLDAENGYHDELIDVGEIFGVWNIEGPAWLADKLPFKAAGLNCPVVPDVTPYKKRKVRILNGAHTSTVLAAYLAGYDIVMDFMKDDTIRSFMNTVIYDEVIPTLDLPKEELEDFAAAVNDRFANPYIKHKLLDIALNSCSKFNARCLPSLLGYVEEKGELPKCLTFSLAAFIRFYKGQMNDGVCTGVRKDGTQYQIRDDADVLTFFAEIWTCNDADKIAGAALSNTSFWSGKDLTQIPGLKDAVAGYLKRMDTEDIRSIMTELIG